MSISPSNPPLTLVHLQPQRYGAQFDQTAQSANSALKVRERDMHKDTKNIKKTEKTNKQKTLT